jgi:hypothetical protein
MCFVWRERKIGLVIKIFLLVAMKDWFNYVLIANYCSFFLNFSYILELGLHHVLDRRVYLVKFGLCFSCQFFLFFFNFSHILDIRFHPFILPDRNCSSRPTSIV